jgi:hypothetical protein
LKIRSYSGKHQHHLRHAIHLPQALHNVAAINVASDELQVNKLTLGYIIGTVLNDMHIVNTRDQWDALGIGRNALFLILR